MGWAKYAEDNLEIMQERMFLRQTCKVETEIKVICKSPIPVLPQIVIQINQEPVEEEKYEDIYIVCKDCGRKFLFSAGAQKHYEKKGWDNPKRCKCCRDFRNTRFLMCSSY